MQHVAQPLCGQRFARDRSIGLVPTISFVASPLLRQGAKQRWPSRASLGLLSSLSSLLASFLGLLFSRFWRAILSLPSVLPSFAVTLASSLTPSSYKLQGERDKVTYTALPPPFLSIFLTSFCNEVTHNSTHTYFKTSSSRLSFHYGTITHRLKAEPKKAN